MTDRIFPRVRARNLEGLDVHLPDAFDGDRNIVAIAFHRRHQTLVDSWVAWFDQRAVTDPDLRFFEVPAISRVWAPARRFIDGGMAAAIRTPAVLRRTFTFYGEVTRITEPLGIADRSTIVLVFLDRRGSVLWMARGGFTDAQARELESALGAHRSA